MVDVAPALPSPGVGSRRKGPKTLPKLPLSAFSPPNTGTSDRFPLPPSPSAVHPTKVVDAQASLDGDDFGGYQGSVAGPLGDKLDGVVISITDSDPEKAQVLARDLSSKTNVLAVTIPFPLDQGVPSTTPSFTPSSTPRVALTTTITDATSRSTSEGLAWALKEGYTVEVIAATSESEAGWEVLEDVVGKATESGSEPLPGKIVFSNLLPPTHSAQVPLVKLLTDPGYFSYQNHIASLSLLPNVYIKFLPPAWAETVPQASLNDPSKDAREWKRRVKMYLGHVVEAFGLERIIFGSSPPVPGAIKSKPSDWYEIARESLAELGLEQADIDAVFGNNARTVYAG